MRASYRVSADGTDNRPVGKGKSNNDGLIKTPPATLAGQSAAVHVGVVSSQAYSVNQRGDIPQGQVCIIMHRMELVSFKCVFLVLCQLFRCLVYSSLFFSVLFYLVYLVLVFNYNSFSVCF